MARKDRIYPGDTYPIALECRVPDPERPDDSRGLPTTPLTARVRLMDAATGAFVAIGGPNVFLVTASVIPQTGSERDDIGGIVTYTVPASLTQSPGDFILFLQVVFPDNFILTEDRRITILEYR